MLPRLTVRYFRRLLFSLVICLLTRPTLGTEIAYTFQGSVFSATGLPFGKSIPVAVPSNSVNVTGHFAYNTSSAALDISPPSASSKTYRQDRTDGFVLKFGSNDFRTDDYFVTVSNNLVSGTVDQIDIRFKGGDLPLESLSVNGEEQAAGKGLVILSLRFGNTEFDNTALISLPTSLHNSNLKTGAAGGISILGDDVPLNVPDVLFRVNSIAETTLPPEAVSVPEPATGALAMIVSLAGTWACFRLKRRRHRR